MPHDMIYSYDMNPSSTHLPTFTYSIRSLSWHLRCFIFLACWFRTNWTIRYVSLLETILCNRCDGSNSSLLTSILNCNSFILRILLLLIVVAQRCSFSLQKHYYFIFLVNIPSNSSQSLLFVLHRSFSIFFFFFFFSFKKNLIRGGLHPPFV